MKSKKQPSQAKPSADYEQLGHMVANIYESGYLDRNKTYKMSFLKGVLGGLGGVIGATIVVGLLVWVLSFFHDVPLVGRFVDHFRHTVQMRAK